MLLLYRNAIIGGHAASDIAPDLTSYDLLGCSRARRFMQDSITRGTLKEVITQPFAEQVSGGRLRLGQDVYDLMLIVIG